MNTCMRAYVNPSNFIYTAVFVVLSVSAGPLCSALLWGAGLLSITPDHLYVYTSWHQHIGELTLIQADVE